jgi:hypothetical protein
MFVKTQSESIVNMDSVVMVNVVKYLNKDRGELTLYLDGITLQAYIGTIEEAEDAFYTIQEGLIKGATFIDYSK